MSDVSQRRANSQSFHQRIAIPLVDEMTQIRQEQDLAARIDYFPTSKPCFHLWEPEYVCHHMQQSWFLR